MNFILGFVFVPLVLFSSVILTAWLTIDDEDFNRRFEEYRKSGEEDWGCLRTGNHFGTC